MATARDFSSRYVLIDAPATAPLSSKWSLIILPKRLELLFRTVFAFPNASSSGSVLRMASARVVILAMLRFFALSDSDRQARYRMMCFVVSVLPEPDSPDITIAAAAFCRRTYRNAASPIA
eukprot:5674941-Prymnesium_polylepis.1